MHTDRHRSRGLFLTFEGPEGSGKSTQLHALAERLRGLGYPVLETAEPGGTPIGLQIRRILLDSKNQELCPTAEMLLMFAARAQNVDQWILPALSRGEIVLCDRFTDSTLVYQGIARGLGAERVLELVDRRSFRTLQLQPAQRNRSLEVQLHRWIRSISDRSPRYLPLLVEAALDLDRVPEPLEQVLCT